MKLKIALIALLSVATISALSLEGFKCRDHTVMTGDPVTPIRTVRICGVKDYAAAPSYLDFQKLSEIEQKARNNYATNSYGNNAFWPDRGFQRSPTPAYTRWPLVSQVDNNESEELLSTLIKSLAVAPATYGAASNQPKKPRDLMEVERLLQEKLRSVTEDTSEIKNSVNAVVTNIKNLLDTLLMQSAESNQQKDINVNVNLKLDAGFEELLKDFMALIKNEVTNSEGSEESTSTEPIEDSSDDSSEDYASISSTGYTNEISSEEQVTEAQVDSAEHSTEQDAKEDNEGNSSVEDFDSWLRLRFGPTVKTPTYDEDTDNSEEENSVEKSEESFESWFNAVYRKHTTEASTDYNSLDEQTHSSQESQENDQKGSVENSKENNEYVGVEYEDVAFELDDIIKSSEENSVSEETTESSDEAGSNIYDAIFVPTTMNSLNPSETAEQLENGDRYNYATETEHKMKMQQKIECIQKAYRSSPYDSEILRANLIKCDNADQKLIIDDSDEESKGIEESKESEETDAVTNSNESKSSEETETSIIESNESKSSKESETVVTESNESKSSEETETAVTESNESKSSEETETVVTESNESKGSEETETAITESNESKSSEESETPTIKSNELRDSSEIETETDSFKSREIDWYHYDDEYPYIQ